MKSKNVLWGLILILVGMLFILRNLGLVEFNWYNIWQMWPVLLVLWGVSVLPVKEDLKVILMVVVLGLSTWLALDTNVSWTNNNWEETTVKAFHSSQSFSIPADDSIKKVHLELDAAAGTFVIKNTSDSLLEFSKNGWGGNYDYIVSETLTNADIQIHRSKRNINFYKTSHQIYLKLNPQPVWNIDLDVGAALVKFDLKKFKVSEVTIDGGAASFNLTLGERYPSTDVTIDAGASSFKIRIPKNSGCDMQISSFLSGKNFQGFKKIESGHYRTPNYDTAQNKININIDAAISNYTVIRY